MPNGAYPWKVIVEPSVNCLIVLLSIMSKVHICCLFLNFSDQLPVSTKYDLRSDPGVEKNYGKLLLEMVSVVPDGIVCFFVSYSYMDGIVNSWHESGILKVPINLFVLLCSPTIREQLFSMY